MKTLKHLFTALLLMVVTVANAYDFEVDGIYYNIVSETTVSVAGKNSTVVGEVVIPDKVAYNGATYIIRSIAQNAFRRCTEMTSVIIGDSVKTIATSAFYNCSGLKEVTIGYSVSKINTYSFLGCTGILKVTFNNKNIDHGFSNNTSIKEVVISDNVVSIGESAFHGCSNLTNIKIPNSVTTIGNSAFSGCKGLVNIAIPDNVTQIGNLAFYECLNLRNVKVGNSVRTLGDAVFMKCSNLSSVQLGKKTEIIGKSAFAYCSSLKEIIIPKSVTTIGNEAFLDCGALHKVIIEDGRKNLSLGYHPSTYEGLFYYSNLDTVYVGRNLVYKNGVDNRYSPFAMQKKLKEVEFGDSVTYISSRAFSECVISSMIIPNSVVSVLDYAFCNCSFNQCVIGNGVSNVGECAFSNCTGVNKISLGFSEVETGVIGRSAFSGCSDLKEVVLGENLTEIGIYAFNKCVGLNKIIIPGNVTVLDYGAFDGCSNLEYVSIGDKVRAIEGTAFYNCSKLRKIVIGKRVNFIGDLAFYNCNSIDEIYSLRSSSINCDDGTIFMENVYKYATLYVPVGTADSYSSSLPWSKFYIEEMKPFTITYMVDGKVYRTQTIDCGADIPTIEEPVKQGYTFSGWSEIPATMPAEDIIITGTFTINTYAVTYIVDGEVFATDSIVYGAEIVPRDEPTKEGHTFSGWSEIPATMPAANITIMGTFSINSYTVTFMIDGEVYEAMSVEFGAEIELPTPPEKEGYIFGGWVGVPDTMPAQDVVIEGEYIVDTTGINDVKIENGKVKGVYDLQGRKVDNPTNGIYIVNGKKVFVK